jgi:hypothetical protein
MSMFDTEAWKGKYRDAAQEKLPGERVEAAWLFYRTGGYAGMALGPLSPLAGIIARTIGKKRAGGLPNQFLLVLTPEKLYALKCKPSARKAKVGNELAVWDRAGLQIGIRDAAVNTEVTIESPAEGEKIVCSTGKDATSREFLGLLAQPGPATAAAPA